MASSRIFQVFFRIAIQNQIRVAQRVIVDEVIQLRPLRHGHVQRILDPSTAGRTGLAAVQQAAGVCADGAEWRDGALSRSWMRPRQIGRLSVKVHELSKLFNYGRDIAYA